jgi:hypothetical protein
MLIFNLKKEWFEKIKSGEKTHEYRVKNNYWTKRIFFSKASKDFKVCFCLGYPKKGDESRRLYGRILGIFCKKSGIKTDLKTTKPVIVIHFELTKEKK